MTRTTRFRDATRGRDHAIPTTDNEISDFNSLQKRGLSRLTIRAGEDLSRQKMGLAGDGIAGHQNRFAFVGQKQAAAPGSNTQRWEEINAWSRTFFCGNDAFQSIEMPRERFGMLLKSGVCG